MSGATDEYAWEESRVEIATEKGRREVPALVHPLVKGVAVTMSNFGVFEVTHVGTGTKLEGTFERMWTAALQAVRWATLFDMTPATSAEIVARAEQRYMNLCWRFDVERIGRMVESRANRVLARLATDHDLSNVQVPAESREPEPATGGTEARADRVPVLDALERAAQGSRLWWAEKAALRELAAAIPVIEEFVEGMECEYGHPIGTGLFAGPGETCRWCKAWRALLSGAPE